MIVKELVNPESITVIGGSSDLSRPGGTILRNIINSGYTGNLYVLNPKETVVQGIASYHDAGSLPETECAIFAVPSKNIPDIAEILSRRKKTKAFIVLSAGFGETDAGGMMLEKRLIDTVESVGGTLIGPNCTGVLFPRYAGVFAGPVPELDPRGVDFAAASGAVAVFTMERAIPLGIKFSSVIAVGNSAQTGVEDVVRYWDETFNPESGSKVKILYIEQIKKPELFMNHCRSLAEKGCRIAAIKAGVTEAGSRAAMSHTGALANPDVAVDALFRKCGIVRCFGRDELVYAAGVLLHKELKGRNIAVITHAGGAGVIAADALSAGGLNVPRINGMAAERLKTRLFHGASTENPIDFLGTGTAEQLGMIIDFVESECDDIHGSVVIFGSPGLFDVTEVYRLLDDKMKSISKPVFPVFPSLMIAEAAMESFTALGRIYFPDEAHLSKALAAVTNSRKPYHEAEIMLPGRERFREIIDSAGSGYMKPEEISGLLRAADIPEAAQRIARDWGSALEAASMLGYPVAMKVSGPVHKSESGGVKLNISSDEDVLRTFDELMKIDGADGILLQQMESGIELYAGAKYEPGFGHIILCGAGGIFVEIIKDFAAALAPAGIKEAVDMIKSLKGYSYIHGARGEEGVNDTIFAEIIVKLSSLLRAAPEIREIDINPLIGRGDNIRAVDCRIFIDRNIH